MVASELDVFCRCQCKYTFNFCRNENASFYFCLKGIGMFLYIFGIFVNESYSSELDVFTRCHCKFTFNFYRRKANL